MISCSLQLPKHVAIIMDGNGRWAKNMGLSPIEGHKNGGRVAHEIMIQCRDIGIKFLTLYTFSAENWKRSPRWIREFLQLFTYYLEEEGDTLVREGIRFRAIGDLSPFPQKIQNTVNQLMERTSAFSDFQVNIALGYGARQEIIMAVKHIASDIALQKITAEMITPEFFANYLQTCDIPDPDLLIRTSGDLRLSNYLLWQLAYSELYFTPTLWPDFSKEELLRAIEHYAARERCYGSDRKNA